MSAARQNVVSVSGGKDSTALLLLAIERGAENLQAVFADTGHEHPATYEYVRYLEQATGVPIRWIRANFDERIARKRLFIARDRRTGRGGKQIDLIRADATNAPACSSIYGLCE